MSVKVNVKTAIQKDAGIVKWRKLLSSKELKLICDMLVSNESLRVEQMVLME